MMKLLERLKEERGQAILLFVGIFTVIMIVAVIVVDFGLWFSERRGAQTDADLPALAGAAELMVLDAGLAEEAAAIDFAENFLEQNDESGNASLAEPVLVDDSCFSDDPQDRPGVPDSVTVRVRHDTRTLFGAFFEFAAPDIGAHAKACAGSLLSTTGLRPWTISMFHSECFEWIDDGDEVKEAEGDTFRPWYGEDCIIRLESPSSQVGSIRLGDDPGDECNESGGGAAKYQENLVEGSDAWCEIDELIDTEPGLQVGPTYAALIELLAGEGECDESYCTVVVPGGICNDMDEFAESFTPPDALPAHDVVYEARTCTTPRAVDIVIIDEFTKMGMDTRPIQGFASFFILQCEVIDPAAIDPLTGKPPVLAVYPGCDVPPGDRANSQIRGRFMQVLKLKGTGGPMDPFGTRVIFLVE